MATPATLAKPNTGRDNVLILARLEDRLSFVYLDLCRIEQDDNGTHARMESETGTVKTTYLPTAKMACLLLGPGTSITAPAAAALARNGCAVLFVGSGGIRTFSTLSPLSNSTKLLNAQALASSDPVRRAAVAEQMLRMRFEDFEVPTSNTDGSPVSMEQLRGVEGVRMKAIYLNEARRRRLKGWHRRKSDSDGAGPLDPVNEALNYANTALYGVCLAAICGLGMSPGLGIIHEGNPRAFVLDIADLYKTDVTIPLAFRLAGNKNAGRAAMGKLRHEFYLMRLLPRIVNDLQSLFGDGSEDPEDEQEWEVRALSLWNTGGDLIPAEWNRHGRDEAIR